MIMTSSTSTLPQFFSSTPTDNMAQSKLPNMSTPDHDSLWEEYLKEATSFDKRIIEDWNKIVDVTLVFVGLIIAVLASFIIDTSQKFKPDPADVTNQLLIAIYEELRAQANNTLLTRVEPNDILKLDQSDKDHALLCNALLYSSLGLCSVAAVLALAAKLWVTSYSERVSSGETLHERATARQKAYSGILVWRMGPVIQSLPLILLIALIVFGFFVHVSIWKIQPDIGYGVGTLLTLNIIALGIASLAAAFIPACPYNSSFSTIIEFIFRYIRKALKRVSFSKRCLRMTLVIISWFASGSLIAWATIKFSSAFYLLVFIPISITFEYATFEYTKKDGWNTERKIYHTPQKYRLPHLTLGVFIVVASILAAAGYFRNPQKRLVFIILYVVGMLFLLLYGFMASRISKSLEGTTDIDAITWLLKLETSPNPELFKKLAGLIDSGRADFRPKILESLMPLLSRVIVSPHPPNMEPEGPLEAYVLSLADLAAFKDDKGSWWLLWEDARYHPTLEEPLREKLVELAKHQSPVGSYAVDVLRSFRTYASLQKPQSSKKPQISWDAGASIMNLLGSGNPIVQSAHSYEEMELH